MNQIDPETAAYELAESDLVTELREQIAEAQRSLALSRQEVEHHRQLTSRVHRSLLPSPVRHPRIDVDVRCLPMDTVGADYCQVHFSDASTCYVTMCDVGGRGMGPSLLATRVSSEVRHFVLNRLRPLEIVRLLNAFIYDHFRGTQLLLSFTAARIDLDQKTITYSGAGRLPVILLRRSSGAVERLVSQNASIGVRQDILTQQPEDIRSLAAGDRLVFYTDGLAETTNGEGRQLGQSGVGQFATNALSTDLFDVADKILGQAALFRYGPPKDDVILIVAEMK